MYQAALISVKPPFALSLTLDDMFLKKGSAMGGTQILIVQGHPDVRRQHLCHALGRAYAEGAAAAGHSIEILEPARLAFPLLGSVDEWRHGSPPPQLVEAQEAIRRARHLVFLYPLWLSDMPAVLKGFLEQVARPGFGVAAHAADAGGPLQGARGCGLLAGRSARVIVSTALPAPVYRWLYGAHSVKLMRRNILGPAGIAPMRSTIVGGAGAMDEVQVERWRARLRRLGAQAG